MPLWNELGESLSSDIPNYTPSNAIDAISAFEQEYARQKLVERVSDLLHVRHATPGAVHAAFCRIPFSVVCTTNIDLLLEQQYILLGKPCLPQIEESHLSVRASSGTTSLLKIHGDVHHPDRLVLTESDYDRFLTSYPLLATYLSNLLITQTAVMFGYSLEDPDFRQILRVVNDRLGGLRRQAWTVLVGASTSEIRRFERRGVKPINLPGLRKNYGQTLGAALLELSNYYDENVLDISAITKEAPRAELKLETNSETRLCLFLAPEHILAFYEEHVFPEVEDAGFVPLAPIEVISPAGSDVAKQEALIHRSRAIVIEATTPMMLRELEFVLTRVPDTQILVVAAHGEPLPAMVPEDLTVIYRSPATVQDPAGFVDRIKSWLRGDATVPDSNLLEEPERLLEAKEYSLALISAVRVLEASLRAQLGPSGTKSRVRNLSALITEAENHGLLREGAGQSSRQWMGLRNEVVHLGKQVSPQVGSRVVRQIMDLVRRLQTGGSGL